MYIQEKRKFRLNTWFLNNPLPTRGCWVTLNYKANKNHLLRSKNVAVFSLHPWFLWTNLNLFYWPREEKKVVVFMAVFIQGYKKKLHRPVKQARKTWFKICSRGEGLNFWNKRLENFWRLCELVEKYWKMTGLVND